MKLWRHTWRHELEIEPGMLRRRGTTSSFPPPGPPNAGGLPASGPANLHTQARRQGLRTCSSIAGGCDLTRPGESGNVCSAKRKTAPMIQRKLMFVRRSLSFAALLLVASCSSAGDGISSLRTVSGTFKTTYWLDDGTKTTVNSPPPNGQTVKAILVPNGTAAGYTTIPITLDSNQSFTLSNVPAGPYFLQLDGSRFPICQGCPGGNFREEVVFTQLIELRADSPDLTFLSAARPDVVRAGPLIHLEVSGLAPWVSGDSVVTASSQAAHYGRFSPSPIPSARSTAPGGTLGLFVGLPDASKHDGFYVY